MLSSASRRLSGNVCAAMEQSEVEKSSDKPFQRLPVDVIPRNYRLELKPDLKTFTFQGSLEITVEVYNCTLLREGGREGMREKDI